MSTVETTVKFQIDAIETLDAADAPAAAQGNRQVRHNQWDQTFKGSATSSPVVDTVAYVQLAATNNGTLDLTALTTLDGVIDCTGKRLVALSIRNQGNDNFELVVGASNGYPINDAAGAFLVKPGERLMKWFAGQGDTVSGTVKTLDWDNDGDEVVQLALHLGAAS